MEESASMEEDSHPDLRISPIALSSRLKNCPDLTPSDLDLSLVAVDLLEASPSELVSVGDDGGDGGDGDGVVFDSCSIVCSSLPGLLAMESEVMTAALTAVDGGRGEMEKADGLVVASDVLPKTVSPDGVGISPWVGEGGVRPQPTDGLRQHPRSLVIGMVSEEVSLPGRELAHDMLLLPLVQVVADADGGMVVSSGPETGRGCGGLELPMGVGDGGIAPARGTAGGGLLGECVSVGVPMVLSAETVGGLPSQIVAGGGVASSYAGGLD
ncbi:hypothetical protein Dimus_030400 [Dionaea muscipula]